MTFRIFLVGVIRLERTTTCTPCKYASQLRHTPWFVGANVSIGVHHAKLFLQNYFVNFLLALPPPCPPQKRNLFISLSAN